MTLHLLVPQAFEFLVQQAAAEFHEEGGGVVHDAGGTVAAARSFLGVQELCRLS